jgi:hypothetical protein
MQPVDEVREIMETIYRLDEYKIIESGIKELRWEAHFGLGAFQEGRCFRKESILFIGPSENVHAGFLKGEFLDDLNRFPAWLKTPYYCKGCDVYYCKTGHRITKEEMLSWMLDWGIDGGDILDSKKFEKCSDNIPDLKETEDVAFRLQRYEIVIKPNGRIVWTTHTGPKTVSHGNCLVLDDILFIESVQNERSVLSKRSFLANLRRLPKWDQTRYYSPKLSLLDCKSGNRVLDIEKRQERKPPATKMHDTVSGYKSIAKIEILKGEKQKIFSERISAFFDSIAKSATYFRERSRSLWFKYKNPNIPKRIVDFRASRVRRWMTYAIALIILTISLLFAFLIGYWNEHREKSHHKRGEHGSSYHRDL